MIQSLFLLSSVYLRKYKAQNLFVPGDLHLQSILHQVQLGITSLCENDSPILQIRKLETQEDEK